MSDLTNTSGATQAGTASDGAGSGEPARAYLVVTDGGQARVIDADEGCDILIGRASHATVHIEDSKASREHARFQRQDGILVLLDLGSRNGTRLNSETVRGARRPLRSGDVVRIGDVEILVAETAGPVNRAAGARLDEALARLRVETGGRATLLRLTLDPTDLTMLAPLLGRGRLLEEQPDGDYACLLEPTEDAAALVTSLRALAPAARVAVARAPDDGQTAAALWRKTAEAAPDANDQATADAPPPATPPPPGVVVCDPAMVQVFERVRKVAPAPTTVLILGETGVGKEVIAEQVHHQSPRARGPFIRLNCGSLPETLLESELFGHERGAFTGADRRKQGYLEAADGGTLFLDEIGELGLSMQTRLLRVLEDHTFMRVGGREPVTADLRIVAATNRSLDLDAESGRFRQDLYFRLSAFVIRVPPLRERPSEIALLAALFARQVAARMNRPAPVLPPATLRVLGDYPWPGNVRELRNAIEHAVVLAEGGPITPDHLPDGVRTPTARAVAPGAMRAHLAEIEQRSIRQALDAENGNQTRAAKRLGVSRRALLYKLERYGLKK